MCTRHHPKRRLVGTGADARLARWGAAVLAVAAGALHLAQVRVHFDEDWTFGAFFAVLGMLQVLGGLYLARPLGPRRLVRAVLKVGIVGSLASIAIWSVSRAFELPFGAEPGLRERVGVADAAANLFEVFTALLLLIWLRGDGGRPAVALANVGAVGAAALIAAWTLTRNVGAFDPDPRAVVMPELVDASAVAFLIVVMVFFAGLRGRPELDAHRARLPALAILASLLVTSVALTSFTLPARGGQNRDCAYGPLADDSGLSHLDEPEPIQLQVGERRSAVILILVPCAGRPVEIVGVRPLRPLEPDAPIRIDAATLEPERWARSAWVAPRGAGQRAEGAVLAPSGRYPLALEVTGVAEGSQALSAVTVEYRDGDGRASINFAVVVSFAVGEERGAE